MANCGSIDLCLFRVVRRNLLEIECRFHRYPKGQILLNVLLVQHLAAGFESLLNDEVKQCTRVAATAKPTTSSVLCAFQLVETALASP